ncbi:TPA: hypothetical protein NHU91_003571 [Pseudomonas aeruginosa]|nr:hypothetical protein [Pseudomonas aeruginosa]HCT4747966.1 hypothetical protein [Pseudomonas aeruginosa]HEP8705574.1 hypothetical protein [Pseudomonas aeruginosa]
MSSDIRVVDGYIDEHEAIEILAKLTGQEIAVKDLKECANRGIVPAYMQFMPKDKNLYNGRSFFLVYDAAIECGNLASLTTVSPGGLEGEEWAVLPFPLPSDGLVKANNGWVYRVFVSRNDGRLEPVTEQHYVRIYAAQEVRRVAKSMKRYLNKGTEQRMPHGCFQTWKDPGDYDMAPKAVWIISPIAESENLRTKKPERPLDDKLDPRERTSLHLMIAALANKAGYPLDNPDRAEAMLKDDLAAIGICKNLSGKGTASGHFRAAELAAQKAADESSELASSK